MLDLTDRPAKKSKFFSLKKYHYNLLIFPIGHPCLTNMKISPYTINFSIFKKKNQHWKALFCLFERNVERMFLNYDFQFIELQLITEKAF